MDVPDEKQGHVSDGSWAAVVGKLYVTGYDPIKDASGKVIGIWYVGYEK